MCYKKKYYIIIIYCIYKKYIKQMYNTETFKFTKNLEKKILLYEEQTMKLLIIQNVVVWKINGDIFEIIKISEWKKLLLYKKQLFIDPLKSYEMCYKKNNYNVFFCDTI